MDEVRKAVEDLIFYCEEAIERVKNSPVEDFTRDLPALQREIKRLVRTLHENEVLKCDSGPFEVDHQYFFEDPEDGPEDTSFWYQYATERLDFSTYDPTGNSHMYWTLWWWVWTDKENHETEQRWTSNPEEVRTRFLTSTSSWVRFLRHKKEQLGTASLAPAPEAPQEAEQLSETDLLKQHFPTSKGQQKAIKILELMRQGLPQKDIAARVGLTKGRVSEYMAKLRELFPDLSPSLQSSETVRKNPRR